VASNDRTRSSATASQAMVEARLRAIVETAVDGLILLDASRSVTLFNPACERMFGYDADEIVGGDARRLIASPDGAPFLDYDWRAEPGQGAKREALGHHRSGHAFPLDVTMGRAEHAGEIFHVIILRDVTEARLSAELREKFIDELSTANEERAHFVNAASHDLKEPIRMVEAFCGLLAADYGDRLDDQGREYLSLAVSAASRMRDLLDQIGDFSRLGSDVEQVGWVDSGECLDKVTDALAEAIRGSGAELSRGAMPTLWASPIRLTRVLRNLIGNALKYVEPGASPRIHVSGERMGEFWRFTISDNGIGIEARHLVRIFEPFKRLHARDRYFGTGLGLAICRKIVEGFGGQVWASSVPGQGSTFFFTLKVLGEGTDDE
jgi:two-component system sensor kinase FixL